MFSGSLFFASKKNGRIFNLVINTFSKVVSKDAILPPAILASHPITRTLNTSAPLKSCDPPNSSSKGHHFAGGKNFFAAKFPPLKSGTNRSPNWKNTETQSRKGSSFNFQPSFFMGELFNFGRVNFSIFREPLHLRKVLALPGGDAPRNDSTGLDDSTIRRNWLWLGNRKLDIG